MRDSVVGAGEGVAEGVGEGDGEPSTTTTAVGPGDALLTPAGAGFAPVRGEGDGEGATETEGDGVGRVGPCATRMEENGLSGTRQTYQICGQDKRAILLRLKRQNVGYCTCVQRAI